MFRTQFTDYATSDGGRACQLATITNKFVFRLFFTVDLDGERAKFSVANLSLNTTFCNPHRSIESVKYISPNLFPDPFKNTLGSILCGVLSKMPRLHRRIWSLDTLQWNTKINLPLMPMLLLSSICVYDCVHGYHSYPNNSLLLRSSLDQHWETIPSVWYPRLVIKHSTGLGLGYKDAK